MGALGDISAKLGKIEAALGTAEDEVETFMFTSESVNEGHPDKLADQVRHELDTMEKKKVERSFSSRLLFFLFAPLIAIMPEKQQSKISKICLQRNNFIHDANASIEIRLAGERSGAP